MVITENQPLINLNTFHIDAFASFFIQVKNENDIFEAFDFVKTKNLKSLILGGGSNVLFVDNYDGVIIQPVNKGIKIIDETHLEIIVDVQAGECWDDVVNFAVEKNLFGIENLSAIPGNAGAAPIQNIGAYAVEIKDSLIAVSGIKVSDNQKLTLDNKDCKFGYRESIFKNELKNDFLITDIRLKLSKIPHANLTYTNLAEYFKDKKTNEITSKEISEAIRKIRKSKLPNPNILGNAGSFFKNPTISKEQFEQIKKLYDNIPFYYVNESNVKIPAGWLIEKCGFKGKKNGNVGSYEKQSLILVNFANATGREIIDFAEQIKSDVLKNFGIKLNYEVNII